ncbi:GDYXXLXY domain-containing protein [Variovorax terrae]|uniref:GDYXXLXY domain-containing protein n=1 Tax=Variovorax terrae TaxID=2923278 RepID=A0A9X2AMQ2_9BURK|nr:GDYXXLXY domain-containing protein [Variovorax terrae]MCJ0763968.1 GDYXXLXY domain-containing protein [Variovorax terrae]
MDLRLALYELAHRHRLTPQAQRQLFDAAQLEQEPASLAPWFWRSVAVLAAALGGLGVILWIAANWDTLGRFGRFALLQGFVLATGLGAAWRPAARAPLGLLALLGTGGLFAYFGQTYQTGADPWQLFALWAALALPLCLAARSDVLWAPWALVAMTAISLWTHAHTGHRWRVEPGDLGTHGLAWAAAALLVLALGGAARRITGAGPWAGRTAATLAVAMVTFTAIGGLFYETVAPHYLLGLLLLAAACALFARRRGFEIYGLSAAALGLNALVVAGLVRLLFSDHHGEPIGALLLIGLASAGLLAASVNGILRLARRPANLPPEPAGAAREAPAPQVAAPRAGDRLGAALQAAIESGVLPAEARRPDSETRPWPVVVLTALGAWLAAVPLLGVVGLLLGDLLSRGAGPYLVGLLVLAGAAVVLRTRDVPVFFEQLAVPALLVGGGSLGFGAFRDLPVQAAAALLAAMALVLAWALRRPWLRGLLGATAAVLVMRALSPDPWLGFGRRDTTTPWLVLHAVLALWLLALAAQRQGLNGGARAPWAAALESIATGWLLATLAGLAWFSGMSFLVGGTLGNGLAADITRELGTRTRATGPSALLLPAASVGLALLATALAGRAWPSLRRPLCAAVGGVLVALAACLPALGGVLLAAALTATTQRWRLAAAAALAAAWIVGSFYYQLQWPLATKAMMLAAAGALLGAIAWLAWRRDAHARAPERPAPAGPQRAPMLVALGLVATLAVANFAIWQKERLIAHGQPVYVELAPVDPRSLMQGDYMRLNFRIPDGVRHELDSLDSLVALGRPQAMARRDARGVATLLRLQAPGAPLAADEFLIELSPKDGRWILVSDAWYFREGDAARWAAARYGEFRVLPDGTALLVGMADERLQPIRP